MTRIDIAIYDGTFIREIRDKADWSESNIEQVDWKANKKQFYLLKPGDRYDLENKTILP